MPELDLALEELRAGGLHRRLRIVESAQGPRVTLDGEPVLLLCSNNYLGLAGHARVRGAASDAAIRWGAGAGASRLVSGTMALHRELEGRLAEFKGTQSALLLGSGYLANTGVIAALAGKDEVVLSDELNHASIIDGCRLARAETMVYRHADTEHLEWALRRAGRRPSLIVTDGVFSMDGDLAPLGEIVELAHRYRSRVMVDEAHATGCVGPGGRGAVAAAGLTDEIDVVVGTLGKALGSYGAYACGSEQLTEYLVNVARPFIFSTALPPSAVAGADAALKLLAERPHRVRRLADNAAALREGLRAEGLEVGASETQIVPVQVGEAEDAMALCERVLERGVFAQAIRPPTVPAGTSRLRMTAMATHQAGELRHAAQLIGEAARELGLGRCEPAAPTRLAPAPEQPEAGAAPDEQLRRAA
jgi:8-amino-7-oxononanoate synthase